MSKYTQDEWAVNSASRMEVNSFKGIAIADCSMSQMINTEEKAANAKLIAAAPDLLKACFNAMGICNNDADKYVFEQLKAAFDKAVGLGETPAVRQNEQIRKDCPKCGADDWFENDESKQCGQCLYEDWD